MREKMKGYFNLNDSKNSLEVFGQQNLKDGYELVFRIDYSVNREIVEGLIDDVLDLMEIENMELLNSEQYNSKFQ